jgi:hypothetical protein
MKYPNMGINQYLIMVSLNTKIKNFNSITILSFGYLIPIRVMQYHHGRIRARFRGEGIAWIKK